MLKQREYADLVAARKSCRRCVGLTNPAEIEAGRYDHPDLGPWTIWQGNLNAELMIIGQDWGDVRYFLENQGHEKPGNPTNTMLSRLLRSIGIDIGSPQAPHRPSPVFLTNAILCLKQYGLQGPVRPDWFANCGRYFLQAQIKLVKPIVVVGLGQRAFNAVLQAFDLPIPRFAEAVGSTIGTPLPTGGSAVAVYHCGARILNTHRPEGAQFRDWQRVDAILKARRPRGS